MTAYRTYVPIIGGREVAPDATLDVVDPGTGQIFARVGRAGPKEVDAAVRAARTASEAGWRQSAAADRSALLRAMADAIRADADALARIESQDVGKPLSQAAADVRVAARYFEFYASVLETLRGETIPVRPGAMAYTVREPFGVTGHITPWNYPLQIASRTIAPSLAAGNCCVLKPAEDAPLSALRLGQLARDVGFPDGVLNIVPGLGAEAGAALSAHPNVDHIGFTGSRAIGTIIARAAADNIVPVALELGGKSPNIIFADADLDAAIPVVVNAIMQNAGQTCSAGSRLLVQRSIYDQVVERVAAAFESLSIGHGLDDPALGPLISARQHGRVKAMVEGADSQLITGGARGYDRDGFFFRPTLFGDVDPAAAIWQEEIFGPVLVAAPFDTDADAVRLANGTPYGMISAVWTRDLSRAHSLIPLLRSAQVYINGYGAAGGVELPFGGYGKSGYGREKGIEGLLEYSQLKTVLISYA